MTEKPATTVKQALQAKVRASPDWLPVPGIALGVPVKRDPAEFDKTFLEGTMRLFAMAVRREFAKAKADVQFAALCKLASTATTREFSAYSPHAGIQAFMMEH